LRLLSAAPWFDDETAREILGLSAATDTVAEQVLSQLRRGGLIVRRGDLERIEEPNRSAWRKALFADDSELYAAALRVFAARSRGEFGEKLTSVLGEDGSFRTSRAIECVAEPHPAEALNELVTRLEDGPDAFDPIGALSIARLIELYGYRRDRLGEFFEGLALWSSDRRAEAADFFRNVVADRKNDRAGAIAEHLLGVSLYQEGQLVEAAAVLEQSLVDLEELNDRRGLEVTLCTYGRVLREIYVRNGDVDALEQSRVALETALEYSTGLPGRRCRTLQYLAQTETEFGEFERALELIDLAIEECSEPVSLVNAHAVKAMTLRAAGRSDEYLAEIDLAAQLSVAHDVQGMTLARALNMAAAAHRASGDLVQAERLARRSVRIGEREENDRHIAHARHTLAAILIDSLGETSITPERVSEIRGLLSEARATLAGFRDSRGVGLIEATGSRLNARLALLNYQGTRAWRLAK
jgi:tetratricopeptide (TPR) repeat protein